MQLDYLKGTKLKKCFKLDKTVVDSGLTTDEIIAINRLIKSARKLCNSAAQEFDELSRCISALDDATLARGKE